MNALSISHLKKTYPGGVKALRNVSLSVEEGDFFGLLGPNGAGKSTLIGILCSLVSKSSGQVRVFDADLDTDINRLKAYLGVVPQEVNFNQFEKPIDIVINQAGYYGVPRPVALQRAEKYLTQLHLWDKRNELSRGLSGGMKRRLMIARALVNEPRLLILDEPTAGVDIEIRRSMWKFITRINAHGTTVILTTHYLEEAENLCRNIAIINHGEIIEHTQTRHLLEQLEHESFVLDMAQPVTDLPQLDGVVLSLRNPYTLEASIPKSIDVNTLFSRLNDLGLRVRSMRNKTNRLEELFMRIVDGSNSRHSEP